MSKRKQSLLKVFSEINFFYKDINLLIIEYDVKEWNSSACNTLRVDHPIGILCYEKHIYVSSFMNPYIVCYNKDTEGKRIQPLCKRVCNRY